MKHLTQVSYPEILFNGNVTKHCDDVANNKNPQIKLFNNTELGMTLLIVGLCIYYTIPMAYIIANRKASTVLTRSPMMIVICLFFLMCDSILNTIIFGLNVDFTAITICRIGIMTTALFFMVCGERTIIWQAGACSLRVKPRIIFSRYIQWPAPVFYIPLGQSFPAVDRGESGLHESISTGAGDEGRTF